jgi:CubicO group peptidase (beta-lactamase class C family)
MTALLLTALLGAGPAAAADTVRPAPATLAELEARIREVLDSTRTPGVSVAIVTRDSVVWTAGLGLADAATRRPATARTLFRIGSTSKAFVSIAVMMLVEQGRLGLDDPLRRHIPEIGFVNRWEDTDPVRVADALEHTMGFDDWAMRDYASSDPAPLTLREGLDFNPASRVARWRPGTRVAYNNSGPPLAAYVVERITGEPFDRFAEDRIFRPIGMPTATYLFPDTTRVDVATLHRADGETPFPYWHVLMRPAGSINASAEDMAAYVRFLLNRGTGASGRLLAPASVERMERSERSLTAAAGLAVGYGLHLGRYADSGFVWVGHDGGVSGGLTNMAYLPEHGRGFAFMINSGNGQAYGQISRLLRDYVTRDLPRPAPPPPAAVAGSARAWAGWYRPDNPRAQGFAFLERLALVRATLNDTALTLAPPLGRGAQLYLPVSDRQFRAPDEPEATLALLEDPANDRDRAIERMGYLLPASYVRIPALRAWLELGLVALWALVLAGTAAVAVVKLGRFAARKARRRPSLRPTTGRFWWPFFAGVALVAGVAQLLAALNTGDVALLGTVNATTLGIFATFLLYGGLAAAGFAAALLRPRGRGLAARWAGGVAATMHLVAAAYLTWGGLIGSPPWS